MINDNFINNIYDRKFGTSDDVKSLGWGSTYSQNIRFRTLLEIGYEDSDSVLDVGCGYGDLSTHITKYTGIDVRKNTIKVAKSRFNDKLFLHSDIFGVDDVFDWVMASGIFCFVENWSETTDILNRMYNISKKGISVNFLHESSSNRDPDMKYVTTNELCDIVSNITNNFVIRKDYLPNDVTAYLYKKTS